MKTEKALKYVRKKEVPRRRIESQVVTQGRHQSKFKQEGGYERRTGIHPDRYKRKMRKGGYGREW